MVCGGRRLTSRRYAVLGVLLLCCPAFASGTLVSTAGNGVEIDWWTMLIGLFGGLALFLFGMETMTEAIKSAAGSKLKFLLKKLTSNRFTGAFTGAMVTAVIQSSSVTTVLVVGFVSAGVMSMTQSIGVIMGANVGTTVTAQIIAFNISAAALPLIAIGFAMQFFSKLDQTRQIGSLLFGLGLIFFGMQLMSEGMYPLRSYPPFVDVMAKMAHPVWGILVAAVFTALVQSSSATTGLVVVMASQNLITLDAGIAMALGANVGTCITVIFASIGKPIEAVRAALVHVVFNVAGVLLWIGLIPVLVDITEYISQASVARQIANANTLFNLINTLIFIGFAGSFAKLVVKLVPEKDVPEPLKTVPRYLDDAALPVPSVALENVRLELAREGEYLVRIGNSLIARHGKSGFEEKEDIETLIEKADQLDDAILQYVHRISRDSLSESDARMQQLLIIIASFYTSLRDLLLRSANRSPSTQHMGKTERAILTRLSVNFADTVEALRDMDIEKALSVIEQKRDIKALIRRRFKHQAQNLANADEKHLANFRSGIEQIEQMRQVHSLTRRIAKAVSELGS